MNKAKVKELEEKYDEMYKKVINLEVNLEDQKLINLLKNDLFIIEENNTDTLFDKNKKKNEKQRNKSSDIRDINNKIEDFETNNEALLYELKELNKKYENLIINKRRNNGNKERKQTYSFQLTNRSTTTNFNTYINKETQRSTNSKYK